MFVLVNILTLSDFVVFNRRIFVTKDVVLNIISNGCVNYIEKYDLSTGGLEVVFSIITSISWLFGVKNR